MKELKKERVNRLNLMLTEEEYTILEKCAQILYEMANYAEDEEVDTLMCNDTEYNASSWLNEVGYVLEYFSNIETVTITE